MSLAIYAAPFNNEDSNQDNDTHISRKKNTYNRTQKRYPNSKEGTNSEKVNSILQQIHNSPEQGTGLADYQPLAPPNSVGVENTRIKESSITMPYAIDKPSEMGLGMASVDSDTSLLQPGQRYQQLGQRPSVEETNRRFMPNYSSYNNSASSPYPYSYSSQQNNYKQDGQSSNNNYDLMIEKLNYMINLLEEQKDEKTDNVTEEVVLYSFLGVFIIFIVDTFSRVGKYTR